jgi:hypothetical protein
MFSQESAKAMGGAFFRSGWGRLAMVLLAFAAMLTPVALDRSHAASTDFNRLFARIRATSDVNSVFVTGRGYAFSTSVDREYSGVISVCYTFTPAANHSDWNDVSGGWPGLKAFISEAPDLEVPQFDKDSSYTALRFPAMDCQGDVIGGKVQGTVTTTGRSPGFGYFDIDLLNEGA